MTRAITQPEYEQFAAKFTQWLGATLTDKDNLESEAIAFLLDLLKIQDRNDFLAGTVTTLGTVIYIPEEYPLSKRVEVLVHEGVHVLQFAPKPDVSYGPALDVVVRAALDAGKLLPAMKAMLDRLSIDSTRIRPSGLAFAWLYLVEREERAVFEAHAYAAGIEFRVRAYGGLPPSLDAAANRMAHGYDLDGDSLALARKILESRLAEISLGVKRSMVATKAIEILRGISPELVASDA